MNKAEIVFAVILVASLLVVVVNVLIASHENTQAREYCRSLGFIGGSYLNNAEVVCHYYENQQIRMMTIERG